MKKDLEARLYTQGGNPPLEKTTNTVLCPNVFLKLFLWCLDEPLHVASSARAAQESTKNTL
jgi:hypothetical protein